MNFIKFIRRNWSKKNKSEKKHCQISDRQNRLLCLPKANNVVLPSIQRPNNNQTTLKTMSKQRWNDVKTTSKRRWSNISCLKGELTIFYTMLIGHNESSSLGLCQRRLAQFVSNQMVRYWWALEGRWIRPSVPWSTFLGRWCV